MSRTVVFFCMQGIGHLRCLLPLVDELVRRGEAVQVMTAAEFRPHVERAGARFVDLFERFPLDAADSTSLPVPSRNVTFAGVYGERLAEEVAALRPGLIVHDTFAVIGPVVARLLGLPHVNVCPNHAAVPARSLASLRQDARVRTSPECVEAVRRLRRIPGFADAHPFSYVDGLSPHLNLYCEPREFLPPEDRDAFEPIAFFGSLAPALREGPSVPLFAAPRRRTRLYVSFGTVIWWYFEPAALAALKAVVRACEGLEVETVISLAGHALPAGERAELEGDNARLVEDADQWAALREADVFLTHHGINSTHESIYHRVPMLSYPFFGDQPSLARRCQELGLALPLAPEVRGPLEDAALQGGLRQLERDGEAFAGRLALAREWELRTMAERPLVVDRVLQLLEKGSA